jgi:hypothetical protein
MRALLLLALVGAPPVFADGLHDEAKGALLRLATDGRVSILRDATVELVCTATETPSQENHGTSKCSADLRVMARGKSVAHAADVTTLEWQVVAGNRAALEVDLFPVDGEAALIVVRQSIAVGDMAMDTTTDETLFALSGRDIVPVFDYRRKSEHRPGPDEGDVAHVEEKRLAPDGGRTRGVPNLLFTDCDGCTPTVLTFDGTRYKNCSDCKPTRLYTDGDTKKSFAPLLAKVLRGGRLGADELAPLSTATLALLRNAPYARHGRPFKKQELTTFFYESAPDPSLPALQPDTSYTDKRLDAADRANIAAVLAVEKQRK